MCQVSRKYISAALSDLGWIVYFLPIDKILEISRRDNLRIDILRGHLQFESGH